MTLPGSCFKHRFRFGSVHPYEHRVLKLLNLRELHAPPQAPTHPLSGFYEAYMTALYIGIKILFLINVTAQMLLLNWFLQTDGDGFYGWGVITDLLSGRCKI